MKQMKKPTLVNTYRFFKIYRTELAAIPYTKMTVGYDSDGYFIKRSYDADYIIKAWIPLKRGEKVEERAHEIGNDYIEIMTSKNN